MSHELFAALAVLLGFVATIRSLYAEHLGSAQSGFLSQVILQLS